MPNQNPIEKLREYFIAQANIIHSGFLASNPTGHPSDTGENRENLLMDFLNNHLPARYEALLGGKIFDSDGNLSKQADIIVYDKNTPRLGTLSRQLFMVEGVGSAIEIKPNLDPDALREGLEKIDSFKKTTKSMDTSIIIGDARTKVYSGIFAFTASMEKTVVLDTIIQKYQNVNLDLCIDFVCVNKSYVIVKNNPGEWTHTEPDGSETTPTSRFIPMLSGDQSLYRTLMLISKYSFPNNIAGPRFEKYLNIR